MVSSNSFEYNKEVFHYLDFGGKGPLAHFSHATGLCAGLYQPFFARLTDSMRILAMDDRGHGRTIAEARPENLKNWDPFTQDLERFLESQGEPVIAMGHSRGAVVSLMLAVKRPDLIKALALTDPTLIPWRLNLFLDFVQRTGLERLIPIAAIAAKRKSHWPDRETLLNSYKDRLPFSRWEEGFLESYIDWGFKEKEDGAMVLACDPAWESACFSSCPVNVWKYVSRLKVPTLVIYGDGSDVFTRSSASRFKKNAPAAKLIKLEDTSHFVPMERPERAAELIRGFLMDLNLT